MENRLSQNQFGASLERYAGLIIDLGIGLERGEYLLVSALTAHRELVRAIAAEAYKRGAAFVNVLFQDEKLQRTQLVHADLEALTHIPESTLKAYAEVIEKNGAFISISGCEDLESFRGIDPARQSRAFLARAAKLDFFYQKIYTHAVKWCVAAAATPGRARVMFPGSGPEHATRLLWEKIFDICRINEDDPVSAWKTHLDFLERRKNNLNGLGIDALIFTSPTCSLEIGLDPRARWMGGFCATREGRRFLPNIPTEEVFSVPCFPRVNGFFRSTKPFAYKNIYIDELRLEFKNGDLVSLEGSAGIEELREILSKSVSNRRLGEVALVDSCSAVAASGLVFHDLLYDENAECHVALGAAYHECLPGAAEMDESERQAAGFNASSLHIDIMLGSPELSVGARIAGGKLTPVMEKGRLLV